MSVRPESRQRAIDALKGWFPMGWRAIYWGACSCCGYDDNGATKRMEMSMTPIVDCERWDAWTNICPDCYRRWVELNREHLVAWELMR